jgi:hypothetical protein
MEREPMSAIQQQRAVRAMLAGLLLTVGATIAPWVDHATHNVLAQHVRDGYPAYPPARVDSAVETWLLILSIVGVLGIASWLWMIWAVKARKRWVRPAASGIFLLGVLVALTGLLTKDTSGDAGLAPLLGWIGMLPSLAGLAAVSVLWRRSS